MRTILPDVDYRTPVILAKPAVAARWHHGWVRSLRHHDQRPVLITEAHESNDDEFDRRRKKYLIMMFMRAVCIVAAALTVQISGWLAAVCVLGALVLPWVAVLVANDRPPKQAVKFRRFIGRTDQRELTAGPNEQPKPDSTGPSGANGPTDSTEPTASTGRKATRETTVIDL